MAGHTQHKRLFPDGGCRRHTPAPPPFLGLSRAVSSLPHSPPHPPNHLIIITQHLCRCIERVLSRPLLSSLRLLQPIATCLHQLRAPMASTAMGIGPRRHCSMAAAAWLLAAASTTLPATTTAQAQPDTCKFRLDFGQCTGTAGTECNCDADECLGSCDPGCDDDNCRGKCDCSDGSSCFSRVSITEPLYDDSCSCDLDNCAGVCDPPATADGQCTCDEDNCAGTCDCHDHFRCGGGYAVTGSKPFVPITCDCDEENCVGQCDPSCDEDNCRGQCEAVVRGGVSAV